MIPGEGIAKTAKGQKCPCCKRALARLPVSGFVLSTQPQPCQRGPSSAPPPRSCTRLGRGTEPGSPGPSDGTPRPKVSNVGAPAGLRLRSVGSVFGAAPHPPPCSRYTRTSLHHAALTPAASSLFLRLLALPHHPDPAPPAPRGHHGLPVVRSSVIPGGPHCVFPLVVPSDTRGGPSAPSLQAPAPPAPPLLRWCGPAGGSLLGALPQHLALPFCPPSPCWAGPSCAALTLVGDHSPIVSA